MASSQEFLRVQNFTIQDLRHVGDLEETTTSFLCSLKGYGNQRKYNPLPVMRSLGSGRSL